MKKILCHHCGNQIVWCGHDAGSKTKGHFSHPAKVFTSFGKRRVIYNGDPLNGTMEQRCADGFNWATPVREGKAVQS